MGEANAACPPNRSPSCFHAATSAEPCGVESPCFSWNANDTQSCRAFQRTTGKKIKAATAHATYGP